MRSHPASTSPVPLRDIVVLATCPAGAVYLHRLGSAPWARVEVEGILQWLVRTPAEDVVAALLRLAAVGTCWWVIGTFLAAVLVRAVGWRPAVRVMDRVAPRPARRLAQRLTGGTLLATSILGPTIPAAAIGTGSPVTAVEVFVPPGAATGTAADSSSSPRPDRPTAPPSSPSAGEGRRFRVGPGDHLWGIARAEVARRRGTTPQAVPSAQVATYWRRVVEVNAARLRSGDPDLLFPGEDVILPRD